MNQKIDLRELSRKIKRKLMRQNNKINKRFKKQNNKCLQFNIRIKKTNNYQKNNWQSSKMNYKTGSGKLSQKMKIKLERQNKKIKGSFRRHNYKCPKFYLRIKKTNNYSSKW